MSFKVIPYRQRSASARELARALGGSVLRVEGSRYRERPHDIIINWGNTHGHPLSDRALNGTGIRSVSNKLEFFRTVHGVAPDIIPEFWTDRDSIPDSAFGPNRRNSGRVVCRTVLSGHSGEGIVIANTRGELVPAPLYTQYIPKEQEYRIHLGWLTDDAGEEQTVIISQQRKARNLEHENPNWSVRNVANGFIYARSDVNPPRRVIDVAHRAFHCFDLDFGAVDVIDNHHRERAYALEINTAPGLQGQTVTDYANFFKEWLT